HSSRREPESTIARGRAPRAALPFPLLGEADPVPISSRFNRAWGRCHLAIGAPRAADGRRSVTVLPREYYEAWYFGHPGRRRVLLAGQNGDQHRYRVRDRAAEGDRFLRGLDVRPGLTTLKR